MDAFAKLHADRAKGQLPAPAAAEIASLLGLPAERAEAKLPELTLALRDCDPRQRIALKALAECDFVVKRAVDTLALVYDWATPKFVRAMLARETTKRARKLLEASVAEAVGITAASTLARINSVIEESIVRGDATNALRGLDMLAKATNAIPQGGGTNVKVGVQIMVPVEARYESAAAAGIKVLDAEFSEVAK